jgi:hypothetical protein
MKQETKDKIQNILSRSYASLPVFNDLPRLAKHVRIYDGDQLLYPKGDIYTSTSDYLYGLFMTGSSLACPELQTEVEQTFDQVFKRKKAGNVSSEGRDTKTVNDGLEGLADAKLKEALRFLPTAFKGAESSALFVFNLDKPSVKISLWITPKGIQMKEGSPNDIDKDAKIDCTISCACTILTSIISGALDAKAALQSGNLVVDNLPSLMVFGQVFSFDAKEYQTYRNQTMSQSAGTENDVSILSLATKRFFEMLGENHKLVKLMKPLNSATMAPAIIELKFALGTPYMTKDVPDSWKIDLIFTDAAIFLKNFKSEQDLKNLFFYEWELRLCYQFENLRCEDMSLHINQLRFTDSCSTEVRSQIKGILDKYGSPPEISRKGSISRGKSSDLVLLAPQDRGKNWKKEVYSNGDEYEGEFNDEGKRHGSGTYSTPSGDLYVGTYRLGVRHGKGIYTMKDGTRYEGEFKDGKPCGKGTYVFSNQDIYIGEFDNDEFHGEGSWSSPNGSSYQGQFFNGKRHGRGTFYSKGALYNGEWQKGIFSGYGIYLYPNGDSYEGEFKNGRFNGYGRYTTTSKVTVEGLFVDGKPFLSVDKLRESDKPQKEKFEQWRRDNVQIFEQSRKLHQQKLQKS